MRVWQLCLKIIHILTIYQMGQSLLWLFPLYKNWTKRKSIFLSLLRNNWDKNSYNEDSTWRLQEEGIEDFFSVVVQEGNKRSDHLNTATEVSKCSLPGFIFLLQNLRAPKRPSQIWLIKKQDTPGHTWLLSLCSLLPRHVLGRRFKKKSGSTVHLQAP